MSRRNLSRAQYDKLDRVHISTLKSMRKSPLQYKYDLEHQSTTSPSLELGIATHCAVFEPDKFLSEYVAWRGAVRRGSKWDAFCEEHAKQKILKADDYDRCLRIRLAVREHPLVKPYLKNGESEVTVLWTDSVTGIPCKGRIDWRCLSAHLDLKTCRDLSRFQVDAARLLYHLQGAWYTDGAACDEAFGKELPFIFVAVQSEPPHDVGVFRLMGDEMAAGCAEYRWLLDAVKHCTETEVWPGAYEDEQDLVLPKWALGAEEEDNEIIIGGERVAV